MSEILALTEIRDATKSLELVGGKAANLAEMINTGHRVPPAFVVSALAFRRFLAESGVAEKLKEILRKVPEDDTKALHEASEQLRRLVTTAPLPPRLREAIVAEYRKMTTSEKDPYVAVRSSATAEDLPEASFAGQQDTYLNIKGEESVLEHVQRCWASLYTPRAIFYRAKHQFEHEKVAIAVVVQRMVDAEKAGVLFTRHPTTGADQIIIEAAWGLGEGVVSGNVSPDNYVVNAKGTLVAPARIASKGSMYVRGKDGKTQVMNVPGDKRDARVLSDAELTELAQLAKAVESHYETPQDIEWAIGKDRLLYLLQARPITTIKGKGNPGEKSDQKALVSGLGASPGRASGKVAIIQSIEELDRCEAGDILVTPMTTPDMVPAMRRAAAIVTDEGGMTCHAAIVSRELGVPCVVGTKNATKVLRPDQVVTVEGDHGHVYEGRVGVAAPAPGTQPAPQAFAPAAKVLTATQVKVNISMPEAIDRAVATDPDGVGLLRIEHIILGLGKHPLWYLQGGKEQEYIDHLTGELRKIVDPMHPRQVWIRTLDAPTDEFRALEGGREEPHEPNPMLGWRGIRRSIAQQELLRAEFTAIKKLVDAGYNNIGVMLPLVNHPSEIREAKRIMRDVGIEPHKDVEFGIMIEIPAAAVIADQLIDEGLDFVSFGTNDLTQYTLAVDRNNENVAYLYSEFHPAIARLIENTIKVAREKGVQTSICGQAGSNPKFVEKLIRWGITSVSANIDAVVKVRETVARTEQRLILEKALHNGHA